ncbi:MAG: VOC family protein [Microthrixaceae bacterium]
MNRVGHFALNADDVEATRGFYEEVLGWSFEAWGPPGFYRCELPGDVTVAVQQRRELVPGTRTVGAEPTADVEDLRGCLDKALDAGGTVLMEPSEIPGVGTVAFVADPSGNPIGLMERM